MILFHSKNSSRKAQDYGFFLQSDMCCEGVCVVTSVKSYDVYYQKKQRATFLEKPHDAIRPC